MATSETSEVSRCSLAKTAVRGVPAARMLWAPGDAMADVEKSLSAVQSKG